MVSDAREKWNEWKNVLVTFINKHAPVKKKRVGRKTSPWITKNEKLFFVIRK